MTPRASLPMYNLPEMQADNFAFWQAIRTELHSLGVPDIPETLEFDRKPVPAEIEPATLFTQVCGWPLQTIYAGQASVIGVPVYDAPFCAGPTHVGVFIVHRDSSMREIADLAGCHFVFNSVHSNSGMNLPRRMIADLAGGERFFASIAETHSQPGNLERVARGEAEATCVDCVTFAFFARHRPHLAERLRVLAPTVSTPAIPFVTASATPPELRAKLIAALANVGRSPEWAAARGGLMLASIAAPYTADYSIPGRYADEAARRGYPVLH